MAERLTAMELELVQRIDELTLKVDAAEQEVERLREALKLAEDMPHERGCMALVEDAGFDCDCFVSIARKALHEQRKGEEWAT